MQHQDRGEAVRALKTGEMQITAPSFDESEIELLRRCLVSGWVTQGPMTSEFEKLLAQRHSVSHALATTSCTAALHLAAMALEFRPDDEIVVPAFTWITSANCAEYVGAKVVFADVDPNTYNIDPRALEAALTSRTRGVVVVHLFGLAAEMDEIMTIANARSLKIIEDGACAIGTTYRGRPIGGFGDVGCFSFHPRKVITTGEGGAVTTNSPALAAKVASLRNHGATGLPPVETEPHGPWSMASFDNLGYNLRLSDIQAAVGVAQFAKLDSLLSERRRLALRYSEKLNSVNELALPTRYGDVEGHSFQSYVVRLLRGDRTRRNAIMRTLADQGIQTRPGTHAVHRLGYYARKYGLKPSDYPMAIMCEDLSITLPIFPGMTEEQQELVVQTMKDALLANE